MIVSLMDKNHNWVQRIKVTHGILHAMTVREIKYYKYIEYVMPKLVGSHSSILC